MVPYSLYGYRYGVHKVTRLKSTDLGTRYSDVSEYRVPEVRSTKSTIIRGYKFRYGFLSTRYDGYGVQRVPYLKCTRFSKEYMGKLSTFLNDF